MARRSQARNNPKQPPRRNGRGSTPRLTGAYFTSLSVKNVRCFKNERLDLTDEEGRPAKWTVILGNNGGGKTTLLQSLAAFEPVRDYYEETSVMFSSPRGFAQYEQLSWRPVRHGASHAEFYAELVSANSIDEALAEDSHGAYFKLNAKGVASSASDYPEECRRLACHGYGASRRMGTGALSGARETGPSDSLFRENVELRNAEEWLLQVDYAASKESYGSKKAAARRDQVKQLLIELLPGVTDLRMLPPEGLASPARVEMKTPYGWVAMSDLSLGYRTLIAWMVDLASRLDERYPDSRNPLAGPAVVLVDEIDLHLHPRWQRQLMSRLDERFPNTQFIVTAHSPLVVQSAQDANIVVLRSEGDHVIIDNEVDAIRNWRVDQILTSDLFGLESARPPQLDGLLAERTELLSKPRLTASDKARLHELEQLTGPLPAGESAAEREAFEIIQRAAARLRKGVQE